MDLKEKLAEIRKRVGDKAEDISPLLSEIQSEFVSVDSDNKANIRESMARKDKIRAQETEIHDLKSDVEKLGDDSKFKELQTENDNLKTFQKQVQKKSRQSLIDKVKLYEKDESFGKVKDMLDLATKTEKDADDKDTIVFDIDTMADDAVNKSLGKIIEYETIEVLGKGNGNNKPDPKDSNPNPNVRNEKDPAKIDRVEQAKTDPKAFAEYRKKERKENVTY